MTRAFNMDCMEAMKEYPDKYFDLAVVDPPYGDGIAERERDGKPYNRFSNPGGAFERYKHPEIELAKRSSSQQLPQEREREREHEAAKSSCQRLAEGGQSAGLVEPGRGSSEKNH